jgi:hypothetical protein
MRIKNREITALKMRLKKAEVKGLALDIDETLSFTFGLMFDRLVEKFGNPENLTAREIFQKYRHTDNVPYWQHDEAKKILREIVNSNEIQKELPLIENANEVVQEINKIIPVVAYITVRPQSIIHGTKFWLKKHGFPEATVIAKPNNIDRKIGSKWKARVLKYLYPEVVGIVDDSVSLVKFLGKDYKGVVYLYDKDEINEKRINVIPCEKWETVVKKIKECKL